MVQSAATLEPPAAKKTFMDKLLDGVETVGNKVPHPVMMFVYLIVFVIVLSTILQLFGVSVTEQVLEPVPVPVEHNFYADTTQIQTRGHAGRAGVVGYALQAATRDDPRSKAC